MSFRKAAGTAPWRPLAAMVVTVAAVVLALVVVVPAVRGKSSAPAALGSVGAHLRPLVLRDVAGRPTKLAPSDGRPMLVVLGASTCAPCKRELPAMERVYRELAGRVAFFGVDIGDVPATAATFFHGRGVTFPVLVDPDATTLNALDTTGLPTTVLVAPDGVIRALHMGALTAESLRALLRTKLQVAA